MVFGPDGYLYVGTGDRHRGICGQDNTILCSVVLRIDGNGKGHPKNKVKGDKRYSFDLVWACESGEHMPDKKKYVEEMMRVLKPGGSLVLATWCQRETPPELTKVEKSQLQFLYDEWAHPYFISIQEYGRLVEACNPGATVTLDDWASTSGRSTISRERSGAPLRR